MADFIRLTSPGKDKRQSRVNPDVIETIDYPIPGAPPGTGCTLTMQSGHQRHYVESPDDVERMIKPGA